MSLIEEALRRVKEPLLEAYPGSRPVTRAAASPPAYRPRRRLRPLAALAVAATGVTVLLIIGVAFWIGHRLGQHATPQPAPRRVAPRLRRPAVRAPRLTSSFSAESLVLSGVAAGAGESYAVINDRIVRIGEQVGAWTLRAIGEGSATLQRVTGEELVLRVRP